MKQKNNNKWGKKAFPMVERQLVTVGRKTKGWWPSGDQHSRHWQARDTLKPSSGISVRSRTLASSQQGPGKYLLDSTGNNMVTLYWRTRADMGCRCSAGGAGVTHGGPTDHHLAPSLEMGTWSSGKTPDPIREFWGMKDPLPFHLSTSKGRKRLKTLWDQRSLKLKDN